VTEVFEHERDFRTIAARRQPEFYDGVPSGYVNARNRALRD